MVEKRIKRCLFCGLPFEGQKKNFEHIVPKWLVEEADLKNRSMPVHLAGKKIDVAMSRIGLRSCVSCNSAFSDLEGEAKIAYDKIKTSEPLSEHNANNLLDWLDKLRTGLWLWLIDAGNSEFTFSPKFRILQRTAAKDRIAVFAKYVDAKPMKGMAIWAQENFFSSHPVQLDYL